MSKHVSHQPLLAERGTRGDSPSSIANRLSGSGRVSLFGLSLLDRQMGTILALSPPQDYHDIQMSSCLEWP